MYGYIYLTENLVNGRCYIGRHKSEKFDKSYKGSGKIILKAFKKYGKDNFVCQPIEWCETKEDLNNREKYWIKKCDAVDNDLFYNVASGGEGGNLGPKVIAKMAASRKGRPTWNKGVPCREDTKEKLRQINTGKRHTEESKRKAMMSCPLRRQVMCIETGEVFPSAKYVSRMLPGNKNIVVAIQKGRECCGYHWQYIN